MKYKVGDKVRVKSLDWYNENKDEHGTVNVPFSFIKEMTQYCGKEFIITQVLSNGGYLLKNALYTFSDEMLEDANIVLELPAGYEIDIIDFDKVILKKSEVITTYDTLKQISGYEISNKFKSEQEAKSAAAMAKISQLLPYYGGAITDKEWADTSITKYVLTNYDNTIIYDTAINSRNFLAFHTIEQRSKFMAYQDNIDLVNDYLMIYGNNRI